MKFNFRGASAIGPNMMQAVSAYRANQEAQNELMMRLGLPLIMDMKQHEQDQAAEDRREQLRSQREDNNKRWEYKKALDVAELTQDREDARAEADRKHEENLARIKARADAAKNADKPASPSEVRGQVDSMLRGNALPESSVKTRQEQQSARERAGVVTQLYPGAGASKDEVKRLAAQRQDIIDHPEQYPEQGKMAGLLARFPDQAPPQSAVNQFVGYNPITLASALGDSINQADFTQPLINQLNSAGATDQTLPMFAGAIQDEITGQNQKLQSDTYKSAVEYLVNTGVEPLQAAMLVQKQGLKATVALIKQDISERATRASGKHTKEEYASAADELKAENDRKANALLPVFNFIASQNKYRWGK